MAASGVSDGTQLPTRCSICPLTCGHTLPHKFSQSQLNNIASVCFGVEHYSRLNISSDAAACDPNTQHPPTHTNITNTPTNRHLPAACTPVPDHTPPNSEFLCSSRLGRWRASQQQLLRLHLLFNNQQSQHLSASQAAPTELYLRLRHFFSASQLPTAPRSLNTLC